MEETRPRSTPSPSPPDSAVAFDAGFLARVSERDPAAVAQFAAHVRTVAWIWLKRNHLKGVGTPGDVDSLAVMACNAAALPPEKWTDPATIGALLRGFCREKLLEAAGSGEAPSESNPAGIQPEWFSGGYQDSVRRLLDELPDRDRELLIRIFQAPPPQRADDDAAYLRRLLFRARLRFRDLLLNSAASSAAQNLQSLAT